MNKPNLFGIIGFFLLISISIGIFSFESKKNKENISYIQKNSNFVLYSNKKNENIVYIKTLQDKSKENEINYFFAEKGESGINLFNKEKSNGKNCFFVNGGYFGIEKNSYFPSGGIWSKNQEIIENKDKGNKKDVNLQNKIFYLGNNKFSLKEEEDYKYYFYSGPKIISNGKISSELLQKKSHWFGNFYRTFLVIDKDNNPTFGFTKQKISLEKLGQKIIESNNSSGKYNVINLDGGPSVSFVSDKLKFNKSQNLPWFFYFCD